MTRTLCILAALTACTSTSSDPLLPGEQLANLPLLQTDDYPCGADSDTDGDGTADVRWEYFLDERGRDFHDVGHLLAGGPDMTMDSTYDHIGHLTLFVEHDAPDATFTYEALYDTLGNNVEVTYTDVYGSEPAYVDRTVYSNFDDLGQPAESLETSPDPAPVHTAYSYDVMGRLVEMNLDTGNDGSVETVTTVVYDDSARTVTVTSTSTSGAHSTRKKTYDDLGYVITDHTDRFAADGTHTTRDYIIERDGARLIRDRFLDSGMLLFASTYLYDCR